MHVGIKAFIYLAGLSLPAQAAFSQEDRVKVEAGQVLNKIPSTIYGSCIEDVNHEIYGGFYAQLIFGESFEEPSSGVNYNDWKKYAGYWAANRDYSNGGISIVPGRGTRRHVSTIEIGVEPDDHARLLYQPLQFTNGTIAFDIRFPEPAGDAAGIVVRVSNAGIGENAFQGYGINISRDGKRLFLTKHDHNYQLLKEAPIAIDPASWNQVRATLQGRRIKVYLNKDAQPLIEYEDNNAPLQAGKSGLATRQAPAAFRNVTVIDGADTVRLRLENPAEQQVSDHWDPIVEEGAAARFSLVQDNAFHGVSAQAITLPASKGRAGIANRSLNRWGIALRKGQRLEGSLGLKTGSGPIRVNVALESSDGSRTYAKQVIDVQGRHWKRYSFNLSSNATDSNARFAIYIAEKGTIYADQVMLFPTGDKLFKGLPLRADIGKAITGEKLTFLRYAGTMVNAEGYRFRKMTGPREARPPYTGHWNKFSTNGFGIEEFLQFCEAVGFEAAFAINIEETPEDMADMVAYLKGPVSTPWGKRRADNGHPAPYKVKYIEIGNEEALFRGDNAEDYDHYIERFNLLYAAMHAKDSSIQFIHSAWWRPDSKSIEKVFRAMNGKAAYWDFHPWADNKNAGSDIDKALTRMRELFHKWDPATTMKCAIFEENGGLHNMQRALGHATTLNAVRRHGDFLLTSCPANALQPYHQNDNGWDQGQIFFTPTAVWGMPPYYAQQMASLHHLPYRVKASVTGSLDVTATANEKKDTLVLHIVNTDSTAKAALLELAGFGKPAGVADSWTLSGPLQSENLPAAPEQISTQHNTVPVPAAALPYTFPAYSYTVLRFTKKMK